MQNNLPALIPILALTSLLSSVKSDSSAVCRIEIHAYDLLDALNGEMTPLQGVWIKSYSADIEKWHNKGKTDREGFLKFDINFDEGGELLFKFNANKEEYEKTTKLVFLNDNEDVFPIQYLLLESEDKQHLAELIRADINDGLYEDALDKINIFEDAYPEYQRVGYVDILQMKNEIESTLYYDEYEDQQYSRLQHSFPVIYVRPNATGIGSTWENALSDLQEALAIAQEGDQIWVASGIYIPTIHNDRNANFQIPSGVQVYGGFKGTENRLEDRNPKENLTILSGEIGDTTRTDNSYTIVYFNHAGPNTILDGFVITGGYADGMVEGADLSTCGAGVFNNGDSGLSSPIITQCLFLENFSREGAAIYNYASDGEASPRINNCKFVYNRSDFNGGAIFNDGNFGTCNPVIKLCTFEGNEASYGAGILNRGLYGECKPVISDCSFTENLSIIRGGPIYNQVGGRGIVELQLSGNVFDNNITTFGDPDVEQTIKLRNGKGLPKRSGIQQRPSSDIAY